MTDTLRLRTSDDRGDFEAEGAPATVISLWREWRGDDIKVASEMPTAPERADPSPGGHRWTDDHLAFLRARYPDKTISVDEIASRLGRAPQAIRNKAMQIKLSRPKGRAPGPRQKGPRQPHRRFTEVKPLKPDLVEGLAPGHPALTEARTLFPSTVVAPINSPRLLVSGKNSRKLGDQVSKGPWSGWPIFHLTLEERATCPRTCGHWKSCYGNGMPRARRHRHGRELEVLLAGELEGLQKVYPEGFVVRLHNLGDFYSLDYVRLWAEWLDRFPALHVFGYTAWERGTAIGRAVHAVALTRWDRFAIRTSAAGQLEGGMDAITTWSTPTGPTTEEGAIICPAQTGATDCCGSCTLCWAPSAREKTIAFVAHGAAGVIGASAVAEAAE